MGPPRSIPSVTAPHPILACPIPTSSHPLLRVSQVKGGVLMLIGGPIVLISQGESNPPLHTEALWRSGSALANAKLRACLPSCDLCIKLLHPILCILRRCGPTIAVMILLSYNVVSEVALRHLKNLMRGDREPMDNDQLARQRMANRRGAQSQTLPLPCPHPAVHRPPSPGQHQTTQSRTPIAQPTCSYHSYGPQFTPLCEDVRQLVRR